MKSLIVYKVSERKVEMFIKMMKEKFNCLYGERKKSLIFYKDNKRKV